jgi:predicted ATPase/DNA-binding SARP family transcriptional activator
MLRLFLFGTPRIEHNGQAVPLRRTKPLALLAYLATARQSHNRETLLGLFWPEFDPDDARNNLRRELSLLRTTLAPDILVSDRLQVAWNPQVESWQDVAVFEAQIALRRQHSHASDELCAECATALTTAAQLYTGEFMAGFSLPDCPAFDEWQFFVREGLRQQFAEVLQALSGWYRGLGKYATAIEYGRRWLALDPLHEPAQRDLMRLYAWSGQHSAALRQYEECVRLLDKELGVAPETETTELHAAIKARQLTPPTYPREPTQQSEAVPLPQADTSTAGQRRTISRLGNHNLPPPPTPFVGRERELAALYHYIESPQVQLITIVGAGGIGKTRLALAAAERYAHPLADQFAEHTAHFPDGIFFVPLAALTNEEYIVPTIVEALHMPAEASQQQIHSLRQHLLDHLRHRRMLLILDNLEHLLAGAEIIADILQAAPNITLLVTSRERLYLHEEYLLNIHGLEYPDSATSLADLSAEQAADYTAVRLFVQSARRLRHDFDLTNATAVHIATICRLVEGMPLALELAAAWTKTLTCGAIVTEIERSLAFLETRLRNVPERHRSMRATFDCSWALLSAEEQAIFSRLSVFRGGFLPEAAAQIAGATLPALATLVDKSLLRVDTSGRYQVHELLRQYAEERLGAAPAEAARVRAAHGAYYLDFLAQRAEALARRRQREATVEIAAEFENIRLAWQQALESAAIDDIRQAGNALGNVYLYRGLYQEAIIMAEQAIHSLRSADATRPRDLALAQMLNELAWLYIRVGQTAAARAALEESHLLYQRLDEPPPPGRASHPLAGLADLALIEGNYAEALQLGKEFLGRSQGYGNVQSVAFAWYILAQAALGQGLYTQARHAAEQAYAAVQLAQDRWFMAYVLNDLGQVAVAQAQYREARQHYQASYAIREEFDDPEGMALALVHQGKVALLQREYEEAHELYQRGLAIYRNSGDRGGVASALHGLGMLACAVGEYRDAAGYFHEALGVAKDIQFIPLMLEILTSASELLLRAGRADRVSELLLLVLRHPASDRRAGERAQQLLVQHEHALATHLEAATQQPAMDDLDAVVARLLVELAAFEQSVSSDAPGSVHPLAE